MGIFKSNSKRDNLGFSYEELVNLYEFIRVTHSWVKKLIQGHDFSGIKQDKILRKSNPIINNQQLFNFNETNQETELTTELYEPADYKKVLDIITPNRIRVINNVEREVLHNGRILCFIIGITTHDGAPVAESYGFVDTYDIPPIDTWLTLKEGLLTEKETILLCWIPNEAIEIMQRAIDVEILGSYLWLDEEKPEIINELSKIEKVANKV